jgi:two-component system, NtrC family, sensor kinase
MNGQSQPTPELVRGDPGQTAPARLRRTPATITAQQDVVTTLVEAAERRAESITELGAQHLVEQRTARLQQSERVLRSVFEALDGALCIVGSDGSVIDVNRRWLDQLLPHTHPGPGSAAGVDPPGGRVRPGTIGSNFFAWCRTAAAGMQPLLADVAVIVQDVISDARTVDDPGGGPGSGDGPASAVDRSVKGRVGPPGAERWLVVRVHPVRDHDFARAVLTLVDITDGMRTQEQLQRTTKEAQRLALVARGTDSAVVITLPDGTVEWVNAPFSHRSGYLLSEAVGRRRRDLVHGACWDLPEFAEFLDDVERGHGADGEFPMASRHGDRYWAHVQVRPVRDGDQVSHLVWVEQDVTGRRDTQQRLTEAITRAESLATALSREKTLLSGVISAIPQLVFWKDDQGRYVGCNAAYRTFRGLDDATELLGRTERSLELDDAIGGTLRALETQVIGSGTPIVNRKVDLPDSHGQVRALLLSVLPLAGVSGARGVIGVGADITHARELERQLAQANRLESIGHLAAGIAHEINTPIQYVSDNTQFLADSTAHLLAAAQQVAALLRVTDRPGAPGNPATPDQATPDQATPDQATPDQATPDQATPDQALDVQVTLDRVWSIVGALDLDFLGAEIPGALTECREGLARVTGIVRAMKDYAHPGIGRADIDVNRAIESTVQVCRNEWKYVAQVHLDLAPDAGVAPCFEGELKQVVLNMIVNAAQAIDEDRTRRQRSDLGNITIRTRREPDELVITIADDGPGMDDEVRRRVFDPFFTTKEVGKGTGQGLSIAHAVIVTKHQGRILLETAVGAGATFSLSLPLELRDSAPQADTPGIDPDPPEGEQP